MFLNIPLHNCSTANYAVIIKQLHLPFFCLTGSSILPGRWQISHFTKWCPDVGKSEPFLSIRDGYTPQPLLRIQQMWAVFWLVWLWNVSVWKGDNIPIFSQKVYVIKQQNVQLFKSTFFEVWFCHSMLCLLHSGLQFICKESQRKCCSEYTVHKATSKTNSTNACVIFVLYNSSISWS